MPNFSKNRALFPIENGKSSSSSKPVITANSSNPLHANDQLNFKSRTITALSSVRIKENIINSTYKLQIGSRRSLVSAIHCNLDNTKAPLLDTISALVDQFQTVNYSYVTTGQILPFNAVVIGSTDKDLDISNLFLAAIYLKEQIKRIFDENSLASKMSDILFHLNECRQHFRLDEYHLKILIQYYFSLSNNDNMSSEFLKLPDELILKIFTFVNYNGLISLRKTCKKFRELVDDTVKRKSNKDPTADNYLSIREAFYSLNLPLVSAIRADERCQTPKAKSVIFKLACVMHFNKIAIEMLNDASVNLSEALPEAIDYGNEQMALLMINSDRGDLDFGLNDNYAIKAAIYKNQSEVVEALLSKKVDLKKDKIECLTVACKRNYKQIFSLLLKDTRLNFKVHDELIHIACKHQFTEIYHMIKQHDEKKLNLVI